MSQLSVDSITGRVSGSAPSLPNGAVVTGVVTATSFSGALTGNVTGDVSGNLTGSVTGNADTATLATNAQGLIGSPNIIVGSVTGTTATFSGNVSVGGTLTYEDVTNIDSVGIITARAGIVADGFKVEEGKYNAAYSHTGIFAFNLDEGHVQEYSAATTANYAPNFRIDASTTLSSKMDVGDVTAATLIVASSSHYCLNTLQVDGSAVGITTSWIGGTAPSAANGSGYDIYAFTIMKTSATPTYHIIANATSAA
jgi:hypothetical protein